MQKKAFYRLACLFTLIILLVGTNLVVYASPDPAPGNAPAATFKPVADVYVISTSATTNYGTST